MSVQERPVLLITRPEPGAGDTAAAARARWADALRIVVAPLMGPVWLAPPLPASLGTATLIFTSQAGVEGLRHIAPTLARPALCVGARTAEAADAAGHRAVMLGPDAAALVAALLAAPPDAVPLVHVRGAEARGDIVPRLTAAGRDAADLIVYDQVPLPLSPDGAATLAGAAPVIVPLFSPRSAALFAAAAAGARAPILLAAISPAAMAAAAAVPARARAVAATPDAEAVSICIDSLLAAGRHA